MDNMDSQSMSSVRGSQAAPTTMSQIWTQIFMPITSLSPLNRLFLFFLVFNLIIINLCFFRLTSVLSRDRVGRRPRASPENPTYLLVVLGSGGHTAEMLNILGQYKGFRRDWTHRTYVVSSGDTFSASKAREFEQAMAKESGSTEEPPSSAYDIVTVHRARRVHQPLLTTPISSLKCLLDCINVLQGTHADFRSRSRQTTYPDLILTNGPGTGVIVILASIILLFFGFSGPSASVSRSKAAAKHAATLSFSTSTTKRGQMRSIYIESWARVKTLSLSGKLLKPLVDRFLVQWPQLADKEGSGVGGKAKFVGSLVA
jgi:beta-1,4-N-acetylglucosaminyltransferase